jgi:squalene-associated FAD-dependent desaturase
VPRPDHSNFDTIIAGGGIAGIAAALVLADHNRRVLLLESRQRLGGRATSVTDPRTGALIDNCQHVALGCCTNYLNFCARLGVDRLMQWHAEQYWIEPGGRTSTLRPGLFPAPAHFAESFLTAKFLDSDEKLAIASALSRFLFINRADHEHETFKAFLTRLDQPQRAVDRFWSPVIVSACNTDVHRVSAAAALHVFQEGFLATRRGPAIALATVPLVSLYEPAAALIARAGGEVRLGVSVEAVGESHVIADGQRLSAPNIICALPFERAERALRAGAPADPRLALLQRFEHSPILGVHLEFDTPITTLPHAVLVDRPTQWIFRKDDEGKVLHAVISAADAWMDLTEDDIVANVRADLAACFPTAFRDIGPSPRILWARAIKERRATFAPTPSLASNRPTPRRADGTGPILAGDYTDTGWPATMEGAARSGYRAAAAALGSPLNTFLAPPLKPTFPANLILH